MLHIRLSINSIHRFVVNLSYSIHFKCDNVENRTVRKDTCPLPTVPQVHLEKLAISITSGKANIDHAHPSLWHSALLDYKITLRYSLRRNPYYDPRRNHQQFSDPTNHHCSTNDDLSKAIGTTKSLSPLR